MPSIINSIKYAIRTSRLGQPPRWRSERVDRLARKRLDRLARYAVSHSSFYREKFADVDLRRLDLTNLPTTTKQEMRDNFNRVLTDPAIELDSITRFMSNPANLGQWFQGRYAVSHTSGSQGPPLTIVQDRRQLEILFSIIGARANAGVSPSAAEGLRRLRTPNRIAVVSHTRGFYPSSSAFEFLAEIARPFVRVEWLSAMQPDLISRLNDYQPNSLVSYASVLESLAIESGQLFLKNLRQISSSSEPLSKRARWRIEQAFKAPVIDHYGLGECLHLAEGCPTHGGSHINADWAIVEVVDDDYRPVPAGEFGAKVLVTNLANYVQPFIRYEVPDRIALAATPCSCGNRLPRIAQIDGRNVDLFWAGENEERQMLPGVLFHHAMDAIDGVREWQAVQQSAKLIELRVELLPGVATGLDRLQRQIASEFYRGGLPASITINVTIKPRLAADPRTGKFRRMISAGLDAGTESWEASDQIRCSSANALPI